MAKMRGDGELVCCTLCGRDTRNKTQICSRCYGHVQGDEMRDRKQRDTKALAGTSIEDTDGNARYDRNPNDAYHGGSVRDDI